MSEFGCDNWRLERVGENAILIKCAQTDANVHCSGPIPDFPFDSTERTRIANECLGCNDCEFRMGPKIDNTKRVIERIVLESCTECPNYYIEEEGWMDAHQAMCRKIGKITLWKRGLLENKIDPKCPLPYLQIGQ